MDKTTYFITTSRGLLIDTAASSEQAFVICRRLNNNTANQHKVVKATPYRLILGNPTLLSIPATANIVVEGDETYSYLKKVQFDKQNAEEDTAQFICPYTNAEGQIDKDWLDLWEKVQ